MKKTSVKCVGVIGLAATLLSAGCNNQTTTAPATTVTSPVTETFTSIVSPLGTATRQFTTAQSGTISVTLTTAGPPSTVVMRMGIGIPVVPGGCSLTTAVNAAAGSAPQLTIAADAGNYCVSILDIGNAPPTGISFFINIVHP